MMYTLTLVGKYKTTFSKHSSLTTAKEKANEALKTDRSYTHAFIYDPEGPTEIRKDRYQGGWHPVQDPEE